jgi:hypothetical protein
MLTRVRRLENEGYSVMRHPLFIPRLAPAAILMVSASVCVTGVPGDAISERRNLTLDILGAAALAPGRWLNPSTIPQVMTDPLRLPSHD